MSFVPPHSKQPHHKPTRPRARPRLFMPAQLPLEESRDHAQWTNYRMSLEEVLMDYQLPQIVLCNTTVLQPSGVRGQGPVPLDKPIILADQRTARHLLARIVVYDNKTREFTESNDSVVIPEDYEGHFLCLQSRTTKDKSHVRSLESVTSDDTPAFVNLTDLTSFKAGPRDPRDRSHMVYTMGNVFLVDEPLPDKSEGTNSSEGDSAKRSVVSGASSRRIGSGLIRCMDERGVSILVPTNQAGEVVPVKKRANGGSKLSLTSSEIIATQKFPLLVRFAYGKRPPRLAQSSRLFTLLDSFQETSLVGCSIGNSSLTLVEIPVLSSLQFQVALNRDEILTIPRMRAALEMCRSQGPGFVRDVKFKYKFSHKVQETSQRMMKLKEDDMPSATVRTRLTIAESYFYL